MFITMVSARVSQKFGIFKLGKTICFMTGGMAVCTGNSMLSKHDVLMVWAWMTG